MRLGSNLRRRGVEFWLTDRVTTAVARRDLNYLVSGDTFMNNIIFDKRVDNCQCFDRLLMLQIFAE